MAYKQKKHHRIMKWRERIELESLLRANHSVTEIAAQMGFSRTTIYNELKRGQYEHLNSDYTTEMRYSPEIAQKQYEENMTLRGTQLKIAKDLHYARYLESKVIDNGYSPEAVLGEIKARGLEKDFDTNICFKTFYNYIDKGIFLNLTNKDLPVKRHKKRGYRKVKIQKKVSAGESIDNRPDEILTREEFGHWEMDTVKGTQRSKHSLLVLTERKTRNELIFKLSDHTAESVVQMLNHLERTWGERFRKLFKTITVDNGTEFAYCERMETSILDNNQKRTKIYYCHPYSSWERGSNEVANKLIRRKIPKGTSFDKKSEEEIQRIEEWINNYPRSIHGYHSAAEKFAEELALLA